MINVKCKVKIYEINGQEILGDVAEDLKIESHWNRDILVTLQFENGKKYTVNAEELIRAINNATNTR